MIPLQTAQEILERLGYSPGPVDGTLNLSTITALRKFQSDEGLTPTGALDEATSEALEDKDGMPWWVWLGIAAGSAISAWGIWRWFSAPKPEARALPARSVVLPARPLGPMSQREYALWEKGRNLSPHSSAGEIAKRMNLNEWEGQEAPMEDEDSEPSTIEVPMETERDRPILSAPGTRPAPMTVDDRVAIDAEAQKLAYDRWSRAMNALGHDDAPFDRDYVNNINALQERAKIDDPEQGYQNYDVALAEVIRADVKRAPPAAQARFRKLVEIYKREIMRKRFA